MRLYVLPATILAFIVFNVGLLVLFRSSASVTKILATAYPTALLMFVFFAIGFGALGANLRAGDRVNFKTMIWQISMVIGIISAIVYGLLLVSGAPPVNALGSVFILLAAPLWLCFAAGGLLQCYLMKKHSIPTEQEH